MPSLQIPLQMSVCACVSLPQGRLGAWLPPMPPAFCVVTHVSAAHSAFEPPRVSCNEWGLGAVLCAVPCRVPCYAYAICCVCELYMRPVTEREAAYEAAWQSEGIPA
jgi:hypothetical protein